jgi:D-alanyl-lipoteichoic acid acyltransferase DltB (MBOAT superfamily)
MLFQTPLFLVFLALVVTGAALLQARRRARHAFLLAASCLFYMAWSAKLFGLLAGSILLDYGLGLALGRAASGRLRRALIVTSLVGQLGLLGLFKYYDFFVVNFNSLLEPLGLPGSLRLLHLVLPVGISFYTFQSLSYTIDVYRGRLAPCRSLVDFALFVTFFPQLVAGPIVRASEFLPQLERPATPTDAGAREGLYLFAKGLVKKVLFADVLATYFVDPVFARPESFGGAWMLVAVYAFRFQIYGDFAGYSDMAIGCGKMMGYWLPTNFRSPFKAASFRDSWARWHITLGSWFRDYVFFPLGGTRCGLALSTFNILFTMTLVGLWHGAAWTFIAWGAYHGVLLAGERLWRLKVAKGREPRTWTLPLRVFAVFQVTTVASLFFRAPDMATVGSMTRRLGAATVGPEVPPWAALLFVVAVATHFAPERFKQDVSATFVRLPAVAQGALLAAVLAAASLVLDQTNPFYYFQF